MIKKLTQFICFTAVLLLSAQFLTAQTTATNPTSSTSQATSGRISNDVDLFLGVNDWADVQMDKWFSYLKADAIGVGNDWQGGLALKLSKAYVGLYYHGRYNSGTQIEGTETTTNGNFTNNATLGPGVGGGYTFTAGSSSGNIQHANYFGILLGLGNHGFKFTLLDNLRTVDVNNVVSLAGLTGLNGEVIPEDSVGYYRTRAGEIIPRLEWGAAQPMQLGKFSTKPMAFVEFAVSYPLGDQVEWGFTDGDGKAYRYENFDGNQLIPKLGVDTGAIGFLQGDWGKITAGLAEEIGVAISGTGAGGINSWENLLKPYVGFTYNPVPFFKLSARLDVPVYAGSTASDITFIGIGRDNNTVSTLSAGFQLKGSAFQKIADKIGIIDQFDFNFGIKANLPGYVYSNGVYNYDDTTTPGTVEITKTPRHTWLNANGSLQSVSAGVTFSITPKVVLDWVITGTNRFVEAGVDDGIKMNFLAVNSLLLSVKH